MNVQIFSDLHISINKQIPDITPTAKYLILAGDIGKIGDSNYIKFLKIINEKWSKIIYVLGNHELYSDKYTVNELIEMYKKLIKNFKNIILLDNDCYNLEDFLIVGTTLWTDPSNIVNFNKKLLFKKRYKETVIKKWDLKKYKKLRMEGIKFLFDIKTSKKIILITHFPMINKWTYNPKHLKDKHKNYLEWMVNNYNIKYLPFYKNLSTIISGHTHYSYDFNYKKVRFIGNQLGYLYHGNSLHKKNGNFKLNK